MLVYEIQTSSNLNCINRVNMTQFFSDYFHFRIAGFIEMRRNKYDKDSLSPMPTICESVEIVLPQHANHHGTTFGGQVAYFVLLF